MDHLKKKNQFRLAAVSKYYFKTILENSVFQAIKLSFFCEMNDLFGSSSAIERGPSILEAWH